MISVAVWGSGFTHIHTQEPKVFFASHTLFELSKTETGGTKMCIVNRRAVWGGTADIFGNHIGRLICSQ